MVPTKFDLDNAVASPIGCRVPFRGRVTSFTQMKAAHGIESKIPVSTGGHDALAAQLRPWRTGAILIYICSVFGASNRRNQPDWAWLPIVSLGLVDAFLARRFGMRFVGWRRFSLKTSVPTAIACYCRVSGRSDRLADGGYYVTLWLVFSELVSILMYFAARMDLPLRDVQFAHYDALLGFNWYRWANFVDSHRRFEFLLNVAYSSILPQTMASVIYFSRVRRPDRNDDLLWTTMLAAIITTAIFSLLPALGPHLKGQYVAWSATLAAIRDSSTSTFSLEGLQGIIAFPSFHVIAAILLIYAHRPPQPSFLLTLMLNLLMLLSTPFAGQHYLVDMISGAVVAAISILAIRIAKLQFNAPGLTPATVRELHR